MVKPRGEIRRGGYKPMPAQFMEAAEIGIAAWSRDSLAELPPEQVHLTLMIQGLEDITFIMRYKSPDTLGFLIEELARYRRMVWPDAEPLELK